ncbi:MAG: UDP-N-acetylmuramate dehydrogenase [Candidatus Margulisbacteria bacterium]|nr:UDP-N-acetylmuramate dehydrogenase [Candidatus Margulisiibacteriota bacterium]
MYTIEGPDDIPHIPKDALPLGGGSNVIICPSIEAPLVRVSPQFCTIELRNGVVRCSAGLTVAGALKWMTAHGLSGLEFAAGVPATIGGMVYMNFGCWGTSMSDLVSAVLVHDHDKGARWIQSSEYQAGYRWTSFHDQPCIILAVEFHATHADSGTIKCQVKDNISRRKKSQPILKPTFGSVFKNPAKRKAWELVEACQLKGVSVGGAIVSPKHANFFENQSHASVDDALALIAHIQKTVFKMYNVQLECEVQIIQ